MDRQPQRAALDILKDARFKQMMEGITVPERRPVMEHDAPQKKETPPQAGGQH